MQTSHWDLEETQPFVTGGVGSSDKCALASWPVMIYTISFDGCAQSLLWHLKAFFEIPTNDGNLMLRRSTILLLAQLFWFSMNTYTKRPHEKSNRYSDPRNSRCRTKKKKASRPRSVQYAYRNKNEPFFLALLTDWPTVPSQWVTCICPDLQWRGAAVARGMHLYVYRNSQYPSSHYWVFP